MRSSPTIRVLPIPAGPARTTTCGLRSSSTRAKQPFSRASSGPRPTKSGSRSAASSSRFRSARAERAEERHRLGLPLRLDRRQRLVVDRVLRLLVRHLADDDRADRRRRHQARGRVDGVACDHALPRLDLRAERDRDLARVHGRAHRDLAERVVLVQLDDRLRDAERCPHRALGVVHARHGRAEDGHDRVAEERSTVPP